MLTKLSFESLHYLQVMFLNRRHSKNIRINHWNILTDFFFLPLLYRPSGDVLETFNFLENADDSDEEEENDMIEGIPEGKDKHRINKHKVRIKFYILTS